MIRHLSCRQHGDVENETIRIVPNMGQYEILVEFPIWDIYIYVCNGSTYNHRTYKMYVIETYQHSLLDYEYHDSTYCGI